MKMQRIVAAVALLLGMVMASVAVAGPNHADFITGPFKNGPEVTKKCLECHEKQAKDFMKTAHWTWAEKQKVKGKEVVIGKKNAINNFCVSLTSNWPRCTSCHAGYGWKDGNFDFTKSENVDCLICHDTTGTYKKFPAGAGHPAYQGEKKMFMGKPWTAEADLVKVAQNVGKPSRANCGSCHFYGGGGDHVKHGDLDSSLTKPSADIDVHMGKLNFTCQSCHKTKDHAIPGESLLVSQGEGLRVKCLNCHKAEPHKNAMYNKHAKKVACQTCHIPTFAKALPTKTLWDWSTAGKDMKEIPTVKFDGKEYKLYEKMKGTMGWAKDIVPSYYWYNGTAERVLPGDKIDPKTVVAINKPNGSRIDANSRIMPFKLMQGKQPYDTVNNTLAVINTFGPPTSETAYWVKYDWDKAIAAGMKAAGMPYSGKYDFVATTMVWQINHMVAPKDKALKCNDCHSAKGRLDWKALGYAGDPMKVRK